MSWYAYGVLKIDYFVEMSRAFSVPKIWRRIFIWPENISICVYITIF
jgi:hypothetical protein